MPDFARTFHDRLAPYYTQSSERLHYIEYPDSPHDLLDEDWSQAWQAVVDWFETFLNGALKL